jgi:glycosyltransferase involved in cell wall biosynthesis
VLQFRRKLLQALERVRLRARKPGLAAVVDRVQRRVMGAKLAAVMVKPDGGRRDHVPADMMARLPVDWRRSDILVGAGAGWSYSNIAAIRADKEAHGFRFALLCYDLIPILFPQFYKAHDVAAFRAYFDAAFPTADLVVVTAKRVEADVRAYCAGRGLALSRIAQVPLGSNIRAVSPARSALPAGLVAGRYALFVSTIEPRKGHRVLYEAWLRLLVDGVPQKTGFKLVFVGRPGWMVDDLMRDLTGERVAGSLVLLEMVDDATMAALYRGAAFCCYPSAYEGYGLPVVEAFRFGKAVLASSGGALPEVTGDYSPILDPDDVDAWCRALRDWIEHPQSRAAYEERIRSFRHPTWDEAAAQFFACLETLRSERR